MIDQCPYKGNILVNLGLVYQAYLIFVQISIHRVPYSGCWSLSHLPQDKRRDPKWKSPQFISILTYEDKQPFTLKFTPVVSLEELFHLFNKLLWEEAGVPKITPWRPSENLHAPQKSYPLPHPDGFMHGGLFAVLPHRKKVLLSIPGPI